MLESTTERKKNILSTHRERRNLEELKRISPDIAAVLRRDQSQEQFKFLKEGIWARNLQKQLLKEEGDALEQTRRRTIPYDKPTQLPAILLLPKARHRSLAFDSFLPLSTSLLKEKSGTVVTKHLDTLKEKLAGYQLNETQLRDTEQALDTLLLLTKMFFENME